MAGSAGKGRRSHPRRIAARRASDELPARRSRMLRLSLLLAALTLLALVQASGAGARTIGAGANPAAEQAPTVTQQPVNQIVEEGQPASFTSTASGSPTVQWQISTDGGKTWTAISGANSTTYTIPSTTLSESGHEFRAVFTNGGGSVHSKSASLGVGKKPAVTQQPTDQTVHENQTAVFKAEASGVPAPSAKWEKSTDGGATYTEISGAKNPTLKVTNVTKEMDGWKYRVVFTGFGGAVTSESATLHVVEPPVIEAEPQNATVKEGETATFHTAARGSPSPTVQWEVSTNGGSTFEPVPGATKETLTVASVTIAMDGYKYRAVWSNVFESKATAAALLTVEGVPKIFEQPQDTVVGPGEGATFKARASGNPTPGIQWESSSNGGGTFTPIEGATSTTLTIAEAKLSENGELFRASFKNVAGSATTQQALLTVSTLDYRAAGWGQNSKGQAGVGASESTIPTPTPISHLGFVTQVSAGGRHSLALRAGGSVESWGSNGFGQLGNEGSTATRAPAQIENLKGVTQVAAGGEHSLALLSNGTVKAWGDNESGQLGTGNLEESEVPLPVPGLSGVTAIAAGEEDSVALLSNGTVMDWGNNERGQLGDGGFAPSSTPVAVKGLSGVTAIAAGSNFNLALLSDGTVVAWGDDEHGELGNKAAELTENAEEEIILLSTTPVPVEGLSSVTAIAAGQSHALALLSGGTVDSWGDDTKGELGNGKIEEKNAQASPVPGLSGVTTISAGEKDSAAVLSSGSLMTWGDNEFGSLGTGSAGGPSDVPVQAHNLSQVVGVSCGGGQVIAFGEALPSVSGLSPKEGPTAGENTVTISGSSLSGATAVHFGTAAASSVKVESVNSVTATAPSGTGTVDVTVTTAAGTSAVTSADRYTYRTAPAIRKITPKGGPATGGTSILISGNGFTNATEVLFGSTPSSHFTVSSSATITAVAPPGIAGKADVRVVTVGGTSPKTKKDVFTYAPVIESVSPPNGPAAGGNTVTITGVGFIVGTKSVRFTFGTVASKSAQCTSSTSCTAVVPAGAAGTVDVTATAAKASSAHGPGDQYTYE
ncbi:MAG TPA: IPT/TIG domain-containing protein [Solirubrobacteraceae bacterium]|jgi:alpha-tubulin suppressor-like RCC1 family protein|nr:IPT/TIG domain-containing protein [Solirubrobacteraceae bacterium]